MKVEEYIETKVNEIQKQHEKDKADWEKSQARDKRMWERRIAKELKAAGGDKNKLSDEDKLHLAAGTFPYQEKWEETWRYRNSLRMHLGRQCDDLVVARNYKNIIAELENEFGWAFVIKSQRDYFCFILMKDFLRHTGTYAHNQLIRITDIPDFLKEYEERLIINNPDEFNRMKKGLILKKISK